MGTLLMWTGLFIFLMLPEFVTGDVPVKLIGAVVYLIGLIMVWFKR